MRKLTIQRTLEFYDVPQLFVASDALDINYLCVLYKHDQGFEYLAVQISELRLRTFVGGNLDLRLAYTEPEQDNSLYHVVVKDENVYADKLLQAHEIEESMLPEAGFYYDADDAINDSNTDSIQLDLPVADRGFFSDMARRMGWSTKVLVGATRKIAVL